MFRIVKVQKKLIPYLEDYRRKPIAGRFYEYELYRVANPAIYGI